jgi:glutamate--cysteine ligase catalytic subunit
VNAVMTEKFWFRKHLAPPSEADCKAECGASSCPIHSADYEGCVEMSALEILIGKGTFFPGLVPLIHAYLDSINCDVKTRRRVAEYLDFIVMRASGEILTNAAWMRKFVREHPAYKKDSNVGQEVAYDLVQTIQKIGEGQLHIPEMQGKYRVAPIKRSEAYEIPLTAERQATSSAHLSRVIKRYKARTVRSVKRRKLQREIERKKSELLALKSSLKRLEAEDLAGGFSPSFASPDPRSTAGNSNGGNKIAPLTLPPRSRR